MKTNDFPPRVVSAAGPEQGSARADAIVELQDVHFGYGPGLASVLRGVDMQAPAESATAILGSNGAGKSTLFHLILGMLSPRKGLILFDGQPRDEWPRNRLSRFLALVPQSEYIPFEFSLLDYVLLGRAPHLTALQTPTDEDMQQALDALEMVGLGALWQRSVPALSGGERQLAMLARALAQEPRVLLLDEPTSHLDPSNRGRVLEILRRLLTQKVTLIFTTHDPNLAMSLASHAVLIRQGTVLAAGPADTTLTAAALTALYGSPVEMHEAGAGKLFWVG